MVKLEIPHLNGHSSKWESKAHAKRVAQAEKIPLKWRLTACAIPEEYRDAIDIRQQVDNINLLTAQEKMITNTTSVAELWRMIDEKQLSAVQVVTAFCKRAAIVHQLTNCLTEIFFMEAIEAAAMLDVGPSRGAWHGIPVSLKDQFNVPGQDSSIGYVAGLNNPATKPSTLVDMIQRAGGIFYCKTNVCQTVMTGDTVNNVFGRTLNPVNKNIIPSGSSGGEAALLACKGSILGIATDTGGSIRTPAAACELFGLKPSSGRVTYKDVVSSNDGNPMVISVAGPMATSLDSLEYFMRNTLSQRPWELDHDVLPLPWKSVDLSQKPLRIGIMLDHGDPNPPHKSFYRIIKRLASRLKQHGVQIIKWESEELSRIHRELADVLSITCLMDGGADIAAQVIKSGEPLILPGFVNDDFLLSIPELWNVNVKARALRNRYKELWQAAELDALICPTNTFAFLTPEEYLSKPPEVGFSSIFNVLDYSVVNIPAGQLLIGDLTEKHLGLGLFGFNVGCQVVCGRWEEEKVLAIAKICHDLV